MAVSDEYAAHVRELLAPMGAVRTKRMFGGAGVYMGELMFGLIAGETLYIKIDDDTQGAFEAAGSGPFIFEMKDGSSAAMRYWRLPDEAADDPDDACRWARLGLDAALRAKQPKKGKAARTDIGSGPWDLP